MEAKYAIKGLDFWVATPYKETYDESILEETIPRHLQQNVSFVLRAKKIAPMFSLRALCKGLLGYPEDFMGGYFFKGGLLGTATSWIFQEGGRMGNTFRGYVDNLVTFECGCFQGEDGFNRWGSPQCGGFCFMLV